MPVLRYYFVGGPFDGAYRDVSIDSACPPCWFLRVDPDPGFDQPFGLVATLLPIEGSERYILSERESASATYLHESVKAGGPSRREETAA